MASIAGNGWIEKFDRLLESPVSRFAVNITDRMSNSFRNEQPAGERFAISILVFGCVLFVAAFFLGINIVIRRDTGAHVGYWSNFQFSIWHTILVPVVLLLSCQRFYRRKPEIIHELVFGPADNPGGVLTLTSADGSELANETQKDLLEKFVNRFHRFWSCFFIVLASVILVVYLGQSYLDYSKVGNLGFMQVAEHQQEYSVLTDNSWVLLNNPYFPPSLVPQITFNVLLDIWAVASIILLCHLTISLTELIYSHLALFVVGNKPIPVSIDEANYQLQFIPDYKDPDRYFGLGSFFRSFEMSEWMAASNIALLAFYRLVHAVGGHGSMRTEASVWAISLIPLFLMLIVPMLAAASRVQRFKDKPEARRNHRQSVWLHAGKARSFLVISITALSTILLTPPTDIRAGIIFALNIVGIKMPLKEQPKD